MTAKTWDVSTGKELITLEGHTSYISNALFSPSEQFIATSSFDKTVKIWEINGKLSKTLVGHTAKVTDICYSKK